MLTQVRLHSPHSVPSNRRERPVLIQTDPLVFTTPHKAAELRRKFRNYRQIYLLKFKYLWGITRRADFCVLMKDSNLFRMYSSWIVVFQTDDLKPLNEKIKELQTNLSHLHIFMINWKKSRHLLIHGWFQLFWILLFLVCIISNRRFETVKVLILKHYLLCQICRMNLFVKGIFLTSNFQT